jgi:hypothetical protein
MQELLGTSLRNNPVVKATELVVARTRDTRVPVLRRAVAPFQATQHDPLLVCRLTRSRNLAPDGAFVKDQ